MPAAIEFKRRLRWADADAAGRLHFPRIFEIIEDAESELLRGIEWPMDVRRKNYDFPRVNINCNFYRIIALDAPFRPFLSRRACTHLDPRRTTKFSTPVKSWRLKGR